MNRGFWRALTENAGVTAQLEFGPDRHVVTVRRGVNTGPVSVRRRR
jgi:hypothetical protein